MASQNFTSLSNAFAEGAINYRTATFKALLLDTGSIPTESEFDTWETRADVVTAAREHLETGTYLYGGFDVDATVETGPDIVNNNIEVTFVPASYPNASYTSSTISSVGAVLYASTGLAVNDLLISFVDFGGIITSSNGDFKVTISTPLVINV